MICSWFIPLIIKALFPSTLAVFRQGSLKSLIDVDKFFLLAQAHVTFLLIRIELTSILLLHCTRYTVCIKRRRDCNINLRQGSKLSPWLELLHQLLRV